MSIFIESNCLNCNLQLTGKYTKKFCSKSCAATYNNKGICRHKKKPLNSCIKCGSVTKNKLFCSHSCRIVPKEQVLLKNRNRASRYRAALRNQIPDDADMDKIKLFYLNCPVGYEVDHIIPISKGGPHHQDNLQYLTMTENRRKGNKII